MANRRSNRILGASRSNSHHSRNQSMNHGHQISASFHPRGQNAAGEGTSSPSLEDRIRKMEESQGRSFNSCETRNNRRKHDKKRFFSLEIHQEWMMFNPNIFMQRFLFLRQGGTRSHAKITNLLILQVLPILPTQESKSRTRSAAGRFKPQFQLPNDTQKLIKPSVIKGFDINRPFKPLRNIPDLSLIYKSCHSQKSINRALILLEKGPNQEKRKRRREEEKEKTPPRPPPEFRRAAPLTPEFCRAAPFTPEFRRASP
ncbi:hypothetical protein M5K25_009114 [Dendrobium thyrsiflorum]|uniref:Uncharacterized protein n=1 Tax=Dendrobium thyrsiflorum TaxID=117978 RepID=A0ABD0V460_DENTH